MSEQQDVAPEDSTEQPVKSAVEQAMAKVKSHPKASLVVGAAVSFLVGLELLGAALIGGAVAVALRRRGEPPPP